MGTERQLLPQTGSQLALVAFQASRRLSCPLAPCELGPLPVPVAFVAAPKRDELAESRTAVKFGPVVGKMVEKWSVLVEKQ